TLAAQQEIRHRNNFGGLLRVALARGEIGEANRLLNELLNNTGGKSSGGVPTARASKALELLRGVVAFRSGQGDEAIKILRAACGQPPILWNVDGAEMSLADALLEMGRADEA